MEDCRLKRDIKIMPSWCDGNSCLSIPAALDLFQDTATLHADRFDIGPDGMNRRNYFWVITRTRLHINRMPVMMDDVSVNTWIQAADRASCERDYSITSGDEVLVYGRSIWAVISHDTGRLVHMKELYPDIEFNMAPPDDIPFARIGKKFEDAEEIGHYKVRSIDIDLGGHMNNVNYVRAMLGCWSSDELREMDISEVEVNFISQTYEGDTLTFVMRRTASDARGAGISTHKSTARAVAEAGISTHESAAQAAAEAGIGTHEITAQADITAENNAGCIEVGAISSDGRTVFTARII